MTEDTLIMIGAYLLCWCGIVIFAYVAHRRRGMSFRNILFFNLLVQLVYSAIFFYLLRYESAGGSGLLWFLFELAFIFIQTIVNFGASLVVYILNRKDHST